MNRRIRLTFPEVAVAAVAVLREDVAPRTCAAVWGALPVAGAAHHAIYSGSECVLLLPDVLTPRPENATTDVRTGDLAFTWFAAGSAYGVTEAFAEICWFYDEDGRPSMPEGPVPVSVFARIEGEAGDFYTLCRRMRREGVKGLVIERLETDRPAPRHAVVHRPRGGAAVAPAAVRLPGGSLAVAFTHNPDGPQQDPRCLPCFCRSDDGGATWTAPAPIAGTRFVGWQVLSLAATEAGGLVAGLEHVRTGKRARLVSDDSVRDWTPDAVSAATAPEEGRIGWRTGSPPLLTLDGAPVRAMPAAGPGTPRLLPAENGGPTVCIYAAFDNDPTAPVPGVCGIHASLLDY